MKYIITESQLNKMYNSYLNHVFKGLHEKEIYGHSDRRFWLINDNVVLNLSPLNVIWVSDSIWNEVSEMFSLDFKETQEIIKQWVTENLGLEEATPAPAGW